MNEKDMIDKFNDIQLEILQIGWKGILEKYHPDNNINHREAYKLFTLYKEIYENMYKRLTISIEDYEDGKKRRDINGE